MSKRESKDSTAEPLHQRFYPLNREEALASQVTRARTASSGLRLRRAWCLRLRLDERNTMMVLDARDSQRLRSYGRFTKMDETKLNCMAVSGDFKLQRTVVTSSTWSRGAVAPVTTQEQGS
ncbi:hypothetical protein F2Q69_00004202 [Brassica cretica]|uniref:Uncharacterized protein n=1 Tax=Brassica cretica TaxID=69181 RepID=A0A8S9PF88_BRACR|nr:hypothetical protein F2Q69_00004202 [Brassica cretica]